jgi:hypothetical protein
LWMNLTVRPGGGSLWAWRVVLSRGRPSHSRERDPPTEQVQVAYQHSHSLFRAPYLPQRGIASLACMSAQMLFSDGCRPPARARTCLRRWT